MHLKCANRFFFIIHYSHKVDKCQTCRTNYGSIVFLLLLFFGVFFDVLRIKVYKSVGNLGSNYSLPEIKRSN